MPQPCFLSAFAPSEETVPSPVAKGTLVGQRGEGKVW